MHHNNSYHGSSFDLGHVPQQGGTVDPTKLFLAQPSHVLMPFHEIPQSVPPTANHWLEGHLLGVDHAAQWALGSLPLAQAAQFMGYTPGLLSVVHNATAGHFAGPPMSVGWVPRGPSRICEWVSEGLQRCYQTITGRSVPKHLAEHGIQNIPRHHIVRCRWQDCEAQIKRQGITRHVREVHMGLKRKACKHVFPRQPLPSIPSERALERDGWFY